MTKITYASLKLKTKTDVETFDFNGNTIEVLKYLPAQDKYDLIMIALERAEEKGLYNPIVADIYFHLYLVYMYTNLTFTDKQREDEFKLYDTLQSNGLIDLVLAKIPESEYITLKTYLEEVMQYSMKYKRTISYFLDSFTNDFSSKLEELQKMTKDIDEGRLPNIMDFAKAINGGRAIE